MKIQSISDLIPGNKFMHTGTYGASGSGKSYKAVKEIQSHDGPGIYFNDPRKEADDYSIPGRKYSSKTPASKIVKALEHGEIVRYKPSSDPDKAVNQLKAMYGIAKQISGKVPFWIDEAHRFNGKVLTTILDDGRGHKVHFGLITQYPKRLKDGSQYGKYVMQTIEDTGVWCIFNVSIKQKGFFDYYNMDYEKVKKATSEQYAFVVMKGNNMVAGPLKA
jgi:hypothetical protein